MNPLVRVLVHFTFFYTCVEGLVVNILYPARLPFLYKDFVLVAVYIGIIVPNLERVLDPPPILRTLAIMLALFGAMLLLYMLILDYSAALPTRASSGYPPPRSDVTQVIGVRSQDLT
jgi:predicted branched-subunit amino acid permease